MTHRRPPERVAPHPRPGPGRNGPAPFHVLEDDCSGDDTGPGGVWEPPVKE